MTVSVPLLWIRSACQLQNYAAYQDRFPETDSELQKRREVHSGLILMGPVRFTGER